ncbi:MAG TPA: DinB family protein [Chitinophagaceae bacterium]|nr:DinB family protein [Chitinophagaceae bacterium]
MQLTTMFLKELTAEAATTRKMLSLVPTEKFGWKPHEKSMTLQQLSTHIAELPGWITLVLNTSELDFATQPYDPVQINDTKALLDYFETTLATGKKSLEAATDKDLEVNWVMRNGKELYMDAPKSEVLRMCFSQVIHHRAQLGVFLRLLNIPIPGSYGPSADEMPLK